MLTYKHGVLLHICIQKQHAHTYIAYIMLGVHKRNDFIQCKLYMRSPTPNPYTKLTAF